MEILDQIFDKIKPYLREEGIQAIEEQGKYVKDFDDEWVTPLVNGNECAYVVLMKEESLNAELKTLITMELSILKTNFLPFVSGTFEGIQNSLKLTIMPGTSVQML